MHAYNELTSVQISSLEGIQTFPKLEETLDHILIPYEAVIICADIMSSTLRTSQPCSQTRR